MSLQKRVVIIGGGFAGAKIAKALQYDFDVVLFDTKDYFEFTPSILRTLVEPEHAKKIQVCHKTYLPNATVYKEPVLRITPKKIITKNRELSFDYAVVASGSSYNKPFKEENVVLAQRVEHLAQFHKDIERAKTVLIVGGGPVGVEIAGEVAKKYPDVQVTLVHSHDRLLQRLPLRASNYAKNFLERYGVRVLLNTRAEQKKGGGVVLIPSQEKTDSKRVQKQDLDVLRADVVFSCVGITPHSECLKKDFSSCITSRGHVRVNNALQCEQHIFCAGDITAIREEKTAQNAEKHADVVLHNIYALENNSHLKNYTSKTRPLVISLGKWRGILTYKNLVVTGILPGVLKELIEWKTMRKYRKK